jgi:hypothetical protein
MWTLRAGYQVLQRLEEIVRQPGRHVPRPIRVLGAHEVGPVRLHVTGQLLLIHAERRIEVEQELQLRGVLRRGGEAEHVVGGLGGNTAEGRRLGIVEFVRKDRHETRKFAIGIGAVAGEDRVRENLRQRLIGTRRVMGQEGIWEVGQRILLEYFCDETW